MSSRMARSTRRRTLRGGGTASWSFAPDSADRTMNNAMAWAPSSCGAPSSVTAHLGGGGLPGLSTGAGVSLQKGGGGGAHYGFMPNGGLAGGNQVLSNQCAPPQSGASGQLNVPQNAMGGARRNRSRNTKKSKSKSKKSKSKSKSKKSRH